jgi:hypothetical protein
VVYGEEGSELIGCQLLAAESNQNHPILTHGCMFTKGEIMKFYKYLTHNHNSIPESPFNCDILLRQFSLSCQNLSFCDENLTITSNKSTPTVHSDRQIVAPRDEKPATISQYGETTEEHELTTVNYSTAENSICQAETVRWIQIIMKVPQNAFFLVSG